MTDFKLKDFVRIAHNYPWPGKGESQTADIIDYGMVITGIIENPYNPDNPTYKLMSSLPFLIQISINKTYLEKILVGHYPFRNFEVVEDMRVKSADTVWKVKSDRDDVVLLVFNPRMESDCDDDGHLSYHVTWDKITKIDGEELTDEEEDTYTDDLKTSLRSILTAE